MAILCRSLSSHLAAPLSTLALLLLFAIAGPADAAPVDVNSADANTLAQELKGVGPAKAAAIVEYRRVHGGFRTLDDLAMVKGIGQKLVDRNRADLRLGRATPGAATAGGPAVATTRTVLARPSQPAAPATAKPRK